MSEPKELKLYKRFTIEKPNNDGENTKLTVSAIGKTPSDITVIICNSILLHLLRHQS